MKIGSVVSKICPGKIWSHSAFSLGPNWSLGPIWALWGLKEGVKIWPQEPLFTYIRQYLGHACKFNFIVTKWNTLRGWPKHEFVPILAPFRVTKGSKIKLPGATIHIRLMCPYTKCHGHTSKIFWENSKKTNKNSNFDLCLIIKVKKRKEGNNRILIPHILVNIMVQTQCKYKNDQIETGLKQASAYWKRDQCHWFFSHCLSCDLLTNPFLQLPMV